MDLPVVLVFQRISLKVKKKKNLKYLFLPLCDTLSDRGKKVGMVQIEQDAIAALEKGKSKRHSS